MERAVFMGCFADLGGAKQRIQKVFGAWIVVFFTILLCSLGISASAQAQVINITSSPTNYSSEGETINFTYELLNQSSYYLTSIDTITPTNPDPDAGPGVTMGACAPFPGGVLEPNESMICTGTYQVTASNIMSGQLSHQISMEGQRMGGTWNVNSGHFSMQSAGGGPTLTAVESLTNPSQLGESTTFRATVSSMGCNAGLAPQGTVTITAGPVTSSAIAVTPINSFSGQGTAEFTTDSLPVGSHSVSAAFTPSGVDNCGPSSGNDMSNHVVNEPRSALPAVNDTNTVVDANSFDNPVTLDITGDDIQTVAIAAPPSYGTATVSGTSIFYTPASGYLGTDNFTYTATNAGGTSGQATAKINVYAARMAPTVIFTDVPSIVRRSFDVTFTFSEEVRGIDFRGIQVRNGTMHTLHRYDNIFIVRIEPENDGPVTIDILAGAAQNLAGNNNKAAQASTVYDGTAPVATLTLSDQQPGKIEVDISFSEDVTGLDAGDFQITNGSVAGLSGSGSTYRLAVAPDGGDDVLIDLTPTGVRDAAGNNSAGATLTVEVIDPVLQDLSFDAEAGSPLTFSVANDGLSVAYRLVTAPTHGTIVLNADGSATYMPVAGFSGEDAFIYDAGADGNTGTVTITVAPPNITLDPATLPFGSTTVDYGPVEFGASGGTAPYSYTLMGDLPDGIIFADGVLSGRAKEDGRFRLSITTEDAKGFTTTRDYSLDIRPPQITLQPGSLENGTVYTDYSTTFTGDGGTAPYAFKINSSDLPDGLTMSGDGILSGTPTEAGSFSFKVQVGDDNDYSLNEAYTLVVEAPQITLDPDGLGDGVAYTYYSAALSADGGMGPYDFTITSGNLPDGLTLASDGTISGTPNEAGNFSFSVTARDTNDFPGARDYNLNIALPEITLGPDSLPAGTGGTSYGPVTLTAAGGMGAYEFTTPDTLPDGISLAADGTLSGSPREDGSFTFAVTAKDENGFTGDRDFTLAIDAPEIILGPDGMPNAVAGEVYEALTFTAAGGNAPYGFTLDGTLPQGMSLEGGKLMGTPTEAGNFQFNVIADDRDGFTGQRSYTLNVSAPDISLTPGALPEATVYADYSQVFTANGGQAPYSYQITAGGLPDGITFADGTLSGTPLEAGDFPFSLRASDENGFTVDGDYTLTVIAPEIALTPENLPDGLAGTEYEPVSFAAEGGKAPYGFELEGELPEGMSLTEGALSGTPSEGGTFTFVVTASDAGAFYGKREYTLTIAAPEIEIAPETLPEGAVYADYTADFTADGGVAPYGFELNGDLPEGLTFEAGRLSGQPVEAGEFTFTVLAMDENGFSAEREYTLSMIAPEIAISPENLPAGIAGTEYEPLRFTAAGGDMPYSFMLEGDLPEGMTYRNGELSGTPTEAGDFTFTMHATDPGDFTGEREFTLTISAPNLVLATSSLPGGRVNSAYSASLQAEGGTAPYGFAVTQGQLPEGLRLAEDGTLSGTPAEPGSFEVTMGVTDRYGFTGSRDYVIAIEDITLPRPRNHELTVMAGTIGTIDLTRGASGGPFTDAAIVANPADEAGSARIAREGGRHILHFSASGIYVGTTSLSYTLSNANGISDPASVMITVVARPDPSLDPEVIGLVRAQTETAKRFAKAQIRNFSQRLEQLHDEGTRRRNSIVLNLVAQSSRYDSDSMSLNGPERFGNQSNDLAFWSGGYVNFGSSDDDGIDLDHTLVGISAGADYRFTPKFTAGMGLGYGRDVTDIGDNGTESRAKALSMAAYGSYRPKPGFFIDGLAGYSSLDFDSKRYVTSTGDMATGTRGGEQLFAALTAGFEHRRDGLLISPYGRLSASRSTLDMFTEEGGGVYNLTYDEQIVETLSGTLGLRFEHSRPMDWGNLTSRARIEYTHEFENSSEARIGYADLGTFPYAIDVEGYSRDELAIGLGFDTQIGELWTLGLDYRTAFGTDGDSRDQTVAVKLDVRF